MGLLLDELANLFTERTIESLKIEFGERKRVKREKESEERKRKWTNKDYGEFQRKVKRWGRVK